MGLLLVLSYMLSFVGGCCVGGWLLDERDWSGEAAFGAGVVVFLLGPLFVLPALVIGAALLVVYSGVAVAAAVQQVRREIATRRRRSGHRGDGGAS